MKHPLQLCAALLVVAPIGVWGCWTADPSTDGFGPSPLGALTVTPSPVDLTSNVGDAPLEIRISGTYDRLNAIDFDALTRSISLTTQDGAPLAVSTVVARPRVPTTEPRQNVPKDARLPVAVETKGDDSPGQFTTSSEEALVKITPAAPLSEAGWHVLRWSTAAIPVTYFSATVADDGTGTAIVRFAVGSRPVLQRATDCNGKVSLLFSEPIFYPSLVEAVKVEGVEACKFAPLPSGAVEMGASENATVVSVFCETGDGFGLSASSPVKTPGGLELALVTDGTLVDTTTLSAERVDMRWNVENAGGCRMYMPRVAKR